MTDLLHLSEVFGPTIQGEGPYAGQRCLFVRLGGCNLSCAPCDTPYTWDGSRYRLREQITPTPVGQVLDTLDELAGPHRPNLVIVTGGEPLLHRHSTAFTTLLQQVGTWATVQIETNGTLLPAPGQLGPQVQCVVSPKLSGPMATDPAPRRLTAALDYWATRACTGHAWFKIVCAADDDVTAAAHFADRHAIPRHRIWIMPEAGHADQVIPGARTLVSAALTEGFNLTLRQHLLLWPDEDRGR